MTATQETVDQVDSEQLLRALSTFEPDPDYPTFESVPLVEMPQSVFGKRAAEVVKFRYRVRIAVVDLVAGTPSNENVVEGWLRRRLHGKDAELSVMVEKTMQDTGLSRDAAEAEVIDSRGQNLNVFARRDGALVFEGRKIKSMLKESFSIASQAGHLNWRPGVKMPDVGKTLKSFLPEHVFVPEQWVTIEHEDGTPYTAPSRIQQRFVHTFRGSSIAYEEVCDLAYLTFTIESDFDFGMPTWETVMVMAERQGIGSCRSQSYGKFSTVDWEKI